MGAGFVLEPGIGAVALDARHDFLVAAVFARVGGFHLDPPALAFGVARVHAEQVAGEDRRFVAAGAGAHFQVQAAVVAGVLRHQLREQFAFQLLQAVGGGVDLVVGQFAQFGSSRIACAAARSARALASAASASATGCRLANSRDRLRNRPGRRRPQGRRAGAPLPRAAPAALPACGAGGGHASPASWAAAGNSFSAARPVRHRR